MEIFTCVVEYKYYHIYNSYIIQWYCKKEGNEVIICGRREEKLLEAQRKHPEMHIKVHDVAEEADRKELLEWIKVNFADLNILINNAGIQRDIDFTKGVEELLNSENEIKVKGIPEILYLAENNCF